MPRTRSASLRVAHRKDCPIASTTLESAKDSRCLCKQLGGIAYYTSHRDASGRQVKGTRVRDRRLADNELRKLLVSIEEGKVGIVRPKALTFGAWCDQFLESRSEDYGRKGSTIRSYQATLSYARPILGRMPLDEIGAPEIRRVVTAIRKPRPKREGQEPVAPSDATVAKHLRMLKAVFEAAVGDELIDRNPISVKYVRELRLKPNSGTAPYTDAELGKLWTAMSEYEAVYLTIAKAASLTGARIGELVALSWDDLDLTEKKLHIRYTWNDVDGLTLPKDGEARTVNLIPGAVDLFEKWIQKVGIQEGHRPIFPAPRSGERVNQNYLAKLVTKAIDKAGIPKVGEGGKPRKPLHSLRASYSRSMLEQGLAQQWVQAQMGHSSPALTIGVYGAWSDEAMAAEAAKAV